MADLRLLSNSQIIVRHRLNCYVDDIYIYIYTIEYIQQSANAIVMTKDMHKSVRLHDRPHASAVNGHTDTPHACVGLCPCDADACHGDIYVSRIITLCYIMSIIEYMTDG